MTLGEAISIVYNALLETYTREEADCATVLFVDAFLGEMEEQ